MAKGLSNPEIAGVLEVARATVKTHVSAVIDVLADGIVEDLTTGLARWRWFPVISRNSSFAFKGQPIDVTEVSRALGARDVVEGSVRTAGDHMRITVQVIDGSSAHHVWAEQFDLEHADRFDTLDRIIERMISALEPALVRIDGMREGSPQRIVPSISGPAILRSIAFAPGPSARRTIGPPKPPCARSAARPGIRITP